MADIIISKKFAVSSILICTNRCTKTACHMAWSTCLIHTQIPINPAVHAMIKISDHIMTICCSILVIRFCHAAAHSEHRCKHVALSRWMECTAFASHQLHGRVELMCHGKCLKMVAGIPVECNSFEHIYGLIIDNCLCKFHDTFFIVIPDIQTNLICKTCFFKRRIHIIA